MKSSVHSDYNRDEFAPGYTPAGWGINPCFPATMVGLTTGHLSCVCPLQLTLCNFSQDLGSDSFGRQCRGERGFRVSGLRLRVFVCDASSLSSAATGPPIHADWQANGSATVFKLGIHWISASGGKDLTRWCQPLRGFHLCSKEFDIFKNPKSIGMEPALSSRLLMALEPTDHICTTFQ